MKATKFKIKNWDEVVEIANDPNQPMSKRAMDMINTANHRATEASKKAFVEWANDILNSEALGHDWMEELGNGKYDDYFENN